MIDIIVPYYNKSRYVSATIESIRANKVSIPYEITIVDDCSPEPVPSGLKVRVARPDKNRRLSGARNFGIENTKNPYIVCLDADDLIPANYIQSLFNTLVQNHVDVAYNDFVVFQDNASSEPKRWVRPDFSSELLRRSPFIHCAAMFRRSVWETVGGYDEHMVSGWEDYDFWMRADKAGMKFKRDPNSVLYYRQYSQSMVNDTNRKLHAEILPYLRAKHKGYFLG